MIGNTTFQISPIDDARDAGAGERGRFFVRRENPTPRHSPATDPEQRRRDRRNRAEQALRIPARLPQVTAHQRAIDVRAEVALGGEVAGKAVGRRHVHHDEPVDERQRDADRQQDRSRRRAIAARHAIQPCGNEVAHADARQDAGDTPARHVETRVAGEEPADADDQRAAAEDRPPARRSSSTA